MISFATEFPVSIENTTNQFIDVFKKWIIKSPHTKFKLENFRDLSHDDEFEIRNEEQIVRILTTRDSDSEYISAQNIFVDGPVGWSTTVVYSKNALDAWIGVRTSRESSVPAVRLPDAKKPVIVTTILENLKSGSDGPINAVRTCHRLSNDDITLAANLINGSAEVYLPVVYVSCDFKENYSVDCEALANDLAGMAHVVKEPNRAFSLRLQIDTKSQNVYGGAIGIYWPDASGRRSFFHRSNFTRQSDLKKSIIEEIRAALLNRRPKYRCTHAAAQEQSSSKIYKSLKSSESTQIDKYIEVFDKELASKSEQIASSEKEIQRLRSEIKQFEAQQSSGAILTLRLGDEQDLYPGEIQEFLRSTILEAANQTEPDSRRSHILKSIASANPTCGLLKENRDRLKSLLRSYRKMEKKTSDGLEDMGFDMSEDGKHYKLVFRADRRYTVILSKTASDGRAGLNSASDISKKIF